MSMVIFTFINQKGGSGKSPATINTAYALARTGGKVLIVDSDPQATVTEYLLGVPYPVDEPPHIVHPSLYHALKEIKKVDPLVINEKIHLLPANNDLQKAEIELLTKANYQTRTQKVLQLYAQEYEYCVIDTPGNVNMLTILALGAADQALVPVKSELTHIRPLIATLATIKDVQESGLNPRLKLWGMMVTQHKLSPLHNSEVVEVLKRQYADILYPEISTETTKYNDAATLKGDVSVLDAELAKFWDRLVQSLLENEKRREV